MVTVSEYTRQDSALKDADVLSLWNRLQVKSGFDSEEGVTPGESHHVKARSEAEYSLYTATATWWQAWLQNAALATPNLTSYPIPAVMDIHF